MFLSVVTNQIDQAPEFRPAGSCLADHWAATDYHRASQPETFWSLWHGGSGVGVGLFCWASASASALPSFGLWPLSHTGWQSISSHVFSCFIFCWRRCCNRVAHFEDFVLIAGALYRAFRGWRLIGAECICSLIDGALLARVANKSAAGWFATWKMSTTGSV